MVEVFPTTPLGGPLQGSPPAIATVPGDLLKKLEPLDQLELFRRDPWSSDRSDEVERRPVVETARQAVSVLDGLLRNGRSRIGFKIENGCLEVRSSLLAIPLSSLRSLGHFIRFIGEPHDEWNIHRDTVALASFGRKMNLLQLDILLDSIQHLLRAPTHTPMRTLRRPDSLHLAKVSSGKR